MSDRILKCSHRWKVLFAFLIGSVLSGAIFGLCVTRPTLQGYWFRTEEIWTFPTGMLWLLASILFFLNLAGAYLIAHLNSWLAFSTYRSIIGAVSFFLLPVTVWLIAPLSALSQLLSFRIAVALVASLALLVITRKWYWRLVTLMVVLSLSTSLIAAIPYIFLNSMSFEFFEVSKFFVNSSVLAVLFGCWLVTSSQENNRRTVTR